MTSIPFNQLAESLARGDEFKALTLPAGLSAPGPNPRFVEPDLVFKDGAPFDGAWVVLVSASGAVGKSTLAKELANRNGAILWDLAALRVGNQTFAGALLELYDEKSTGVRKRLRDGRSLVVLDALDESQIRSGPENFDAFITDLANALKPTEKDEPRTRPTVVLFARSETAIEVQLLLEECRVPVTHLEIINFDKEQAQLFIERALDEMHGDSGPHRKQAQPFAAARDALFDLVYGFFSVNQDGAWEDERVRGFLGYAPVLEALVNYLNFQNYIQLKSDLEAGMGAVEDPWQFLSTIVEDLLRREQGKVRDGVRGSLEQAAEKTGWSDWGHLYLPDEQCARVLGYWLRSTEQFDNGLPPELASGYEEAVEVALPQHPFLRERRFANVVFKEYVFAREVLSGGPLAADLRAAMQGQEAPFLPSQLFGRFINHLQGDGDGTIVIDSEDFGVLYESLLARDAHMDVSVFDDEDLVVMSAAFDDHRKTVFEVQLLDSGEGVRVWRRLRDATIQLRGRLSLGLMGQRLDLGPGVEADCGELSFECAETSINAACGVSLFAGNYSSAAQPLRISVRNADQGGLSVAWPSVAHPWAPYRSERPGTATELGDTTRGDALRKFLLMFRRQRVRRESTLRNSRWAASQHRDRDDLIELALAHRVLVPLRPRNEMEFNNEFASLRTLVEGEPALTTPARQFISEYLGEQEASRVLGSA